MQITQNIISGQSRDYFIKSLRTQTSSETPGRKLSKTARQLDPKHQEKTLRGGGEEKSVWWPEREEKRREEDCCAGAILDFICLLGDGPPALKSPLGARIV